MRPNEERWKELCRQAAVEQDPAKLNHLVKEIDEFFDSKRDPNPESASIKKEMLRTRPRNATGAALNWTQVRGSP